MRKSIKDEKNKESSMKKKVTEKAGKLGMGAQHRMTRVKLRMQKFMVYGGGAIWKTVQLGLT